MKKKYLIGLIVVVVIFSPVLVFISFALLALTLAVYSVLCLVAMMMKAIAISTAGCHYQLLVKLSKVGLPPSEREAEDMSQSGCSNPNHASAYRLPVGLSAPRNLGGWPTFVGKSMCQSGEFTGLLDGFDGRKHSKPNN